MEELKSEDFIDIEDHGTEVPLCDADDDSSEPDKYYVNAILPDDFLDDDTTLYKNIDGTFDLKYYLKDEAGMKCFSGRYESIPYQEENQDIQHDLPLCDTDDESPTTKDD